MRVRATRPAQRLGGLGTILLVLLAISGAGARAAVHRDGRTDARHRLRLVPPPVTGAALSWPPAPAEGR